MIHWCPEETAAVIAAGSAAAFGLVWVKARWYIFLAWLRAKLGLADKRHCCLHVAKNRAPVMTKAELMLTIEEIRESFDAARKADCVVKVTRHPGRVVRLFNGLSEGLEPTYAPRYVRRYRSELPKGYSLLIKPEEPLSDEKVVHLEDITPIDAANRLDLPPLDPEAEAVEWMNRVLAPTKEKP